MSYRPPTLGRKEVDLYRLFREVTAYGGCESVVSKEGTWAKIYRGLDNFSPTETSASFRLKKMYTKYLLAYEKHVFNFLPIPQKKHRYAHTPTPPIPLTAQSSNTPVSSGIQNSAIFPPSYSYQSSDDVASKRVKPTTTPSESYPVYTQHTIHQSTLLAPSTKYKPGAGIGLTGGTVNWSRAPATHTVNKRVAMDNARSSSLSPMVCPTPLQLGPVGSEEVRGDHEVGGHRLRSSISPTIGGQVNRNRGSSRSSPLPSSGVQTRQQVRYS